MNRRELLEKAVHELDSGSGTVILTISIRRTIMEKHAVVSGSSTRPERLNSCEVLL
jgi:hypothetical protein